MNMRETSEELPDIEVHSMSERRDYEAIAKVHGAIETIAGILGEAKEGTVSLVEPELISRRLRDLADHFDEAYPEEEPA